MTDEVKLTTREKVGFYCLLFIARHFIRNMTDEQTELFKKIEWEVRYTL